MDEKELLTTGGLGGLIIAVLQTIKSIWPNVKDTTAKLISLGLNAFFIGGFYVLTKLQGMDPNTVTFVDLGWLVIGFFAFTLAGWCGTSGGYRNLVKPFTQVRQ